MNSHVGPKALSRQQAYDDSFALSGMDVVSDRTIYMLMVLRDVFSPMQKCKLFGMN